MEVERLATAAAAAVVHDAHQADTIVIAIANAFMNGDEIENLPSQLPRRRQAYYLNAESAATSFVFYVDVHIDVDVGSFAIDVFVNVLHLR